MCAGNCVDIIKRFRKSNSCFSDGDCCAGETCVTFGVGTENESKACRTTCQTTADCAAYQFPVFLACIDTVGPVPFCGTPE